MTLINWCFWYTNLVKWGLKFFSLFILVWTYGPCLIHHKLDLNACPKLELEGRFTALTIVRYGLGDDDDIEVLYFSEYLI